MLKIFTFGHIAQTQAVNVIASITLDTEEHFVVLLFLALDARLAG